MTCFESLTISRSADPGFTVVVNFQASPACVSYHLREKDGVISTPVELDLEMYPHSELAPSIRIGQFGPVNKFIDSVVLNEQVRRGWRDPLPKKNPPYHCAYCDKPIQNGQLSVPDEFGEKGDRLHLHCSVEQADGDAIDNEHGDS